MYLLLSSYIGMVIVREILNISGGDRSLCNLPVELLSEIFLKLPVRSLLACQCVCKSFDRLIKSPAFTASHVNHNSTSSTNTYCSVNILVIDEDFKDRCEQILINNEGGSVISTSHVRQSNPLATNISVIGSCNGLFCAYLNIFGEPWASRIMLWNPVTRDNRFLPKPKIDAPHRQFFPVNAFGFVPESNEFKVVRIVSYYTSGNIELPSPGDVFVMQAEVYKMSTDSWTVLNASAIPCYGPQHMFLEIESFLPLKFNRPTRTLFLEGAFHWLAVNPKNVYDLCAAVVAFDLEHEEFKIISLLESHRILHSKKGQLEIINDLLGLIVPHRPGFSPDFDVWVMNDYGSKESWTRMYCVKQSTGFARPCGYWKDDLLLMVENGRRNRLFFYDLRTKERQNILNSGYFYYEYFCSYVETLVPVSRRNAVVENADD
ncbi:F-box/kelch-repeat protein At3g23880 isoform X2 [Daucus carota subsp. sativus]|uniref:F-box/kelch-repeat protein At3g23880 isoform X2 n=1 Tax=Daucus carota subsp. sativus TaxID=79200 RepID=UPI0007F04532|nr:PREDICTED: F-box/kelch-repeat protein At3g23880-like isoform X2 [Daucus carota subsp. sativus]